MRPRYATIGLLVLILAGPVWAQNPYYDHGSYPAPGSSGSSASMRAELDLIEAGFAKLPTLSGNANKFVVVNGSGTALTVSPGAILSGPAFPSSPATNSLFLITDDTTQGACDSGGGSVVTLCRWDGSAWVYDFAPVQGLDDVIAVDRTFGGAVSQATAPRIGDSGSGEYWILLRDPTAGLIFTCEIGGVLDNCHKGTKLLNGKLYRITNQSDVVTWEVDHTGALTEGSINVETAGVTLTTTEEQWWDVAACQGSTPQLIWNYLTGANPAAACDTGSNTQKGYASFDDTTDEAFQMDWVLPNGFTGAIDFHFVWKAAATSGAVGWCVQLIRVPDGSTSDPAFPAQSSSNCVSDTAKGTTLQENQATIFGVPCPTPCAPRDHVYVRISRDANGSAVTDSMTGDAHLMKVGRTWRVAK